MTIFTMLLGFFAVIGVIASLAALVLVSANAIDRRRREKRESMERAKFEARPRCKILTIGGFVSNELLRPWPDGWEFDEEEKFPAYTIADNGKVLFGGYTRAELAEIVARRKEFE